MEKQFNQLIVFLAVMILLSKSKASINYRADENKINYVMSEIVSAAKYDLSLIPQILLSEKSDLEAELDVRLSDEEYKTIRALVGKLLAYGVKVKLVPADEMVLASQELLGGGAKK